ncbi:MAG TPA: hypothetical protein VF384_14780 [Planctomycetota bacterium]
MNQRLLLLTVLALLAGAVVAAMAWFASEEPSLHPTPSTEPCGAPAPRTAAAPSSEAVEATTSPASAAVRDAATADTRTPLPLPDDLQWIEVTVADKATGTPVPNAQVLWFDYESSHRIASDSAMSQLQRQMLENDRELWAEQFGWRTTTDGNGTARVGLVNVTTVVARSESRYGAIEVQKNTIAPAGGHRVQLTPDLEALVQVLDAHGAPAPDVLIALAAHDSDGTFEFLFNWMPVAATTAPDGIARVRHLQTITSSVADPYERYPARQWRVRTILPGHDDDGVAVSITEPPAEPIVLRLPVCGRVRVRAEFAGQPLHRLTAAHLDIAEGVDRSGQAGLEQLADPDGWVRFPRVPLGGRYVAATDTDGVGDLRATFDGPRTDGEEVVVVLTPGQDEILLRGRIVDEDRRPVADQRVHLQARGPQFRAICRLTTDAAGAFLVVLGRASKDNRVDQLSFTLARRDGAPKRADATPRELRVGVEDLGDLVMSTGALVAAGRFESGGAPHKQRVQFWVERREQSPRGERWRRQSTMNHQAEDRFEVRGTLAQGTYRLSFHSDDSLPITPIPFAPGAADLTVNVRTGHELAACVLLPASIPESDLAAVLVAAGSAAAATAGENAGRNDDRQQARPWRADGERYNLQWNALAPGSHSLELRLWTHATPLIVVPDVQVPGPAGGDRRLVDIDLRKLVRVLTVELLDANGQPLADAEGVIFPAGQDPRAEWFGYRIEGPSSLLLTKPGPLEFVVIAEGHRPTPALATGDNVQVRLEPWPTIALTFSDMPQLPSKVIATATFEPAEKDSLRYQSQGGSGMREELMRRRPVTIEDGRATVPIGDGPHRLELSLYGNRRWAEVTVEARQFLSTDGQAHIVVAPEQWQKALQVVEQPPK